MEEQHPPIPDTSGDAAPVDLHREINMLKSQLKVLEERIVSTERKHTQLPVIPQTNLLSGSFLTRSFAVMGHYLVASMIITIPAMILIFVLALAVSLSFSGM